MNLRLSALLAPLPLLALGPVIVHVSPLAGGRTLAFALVAGLLLGVLLQRTRFCFFCHARDWFDRGDARGLLAIMLALAVGLAGTTVVVSAWVPVPQPGRLPPDLHIGPVSGVLVLAGLAFGAGMVVSGSCISAHWYRLAEGSAVAPFALIGTAGGFVLGFLSWNPLYILAVAEAPVVWLPSHLGHGGALLLQLVVLALVAAGLWHRHVCLAARRAASDAPEREARIAPGGAADPPRSLSELGRRLWTGRWPYWVGGLGVGLVATFVLLRMRPLGVTTTLGSGARALATQQGWVPTRLEGLDGFSGCATLPGTQWLTPHALLLGLLAGAFASALAAGQFRPRRPTSRDAARGLAGGLLLGWGAMTGLGCSIGTLLSGTMAGALSAWVFGASMFAAVGLDLALQRRWLPGVRSARVG